MAKQPKTAVPIVFGAMTIGKEGAMQARIHDLPTTNTILDIFQSHGHTEVDTSRAYSEGSCETMLGELSWHQRGIKMQTKVFPSIMAPLDGANIRHTPEDLRSTLMRSVAALRAEKGEIDIWYLHWPDATTPYKETCEAVDALYREGWFKRWGICNYQAWEVAQICELCDANGWVRPAVYQGIYNALYRAVERELFQCLRHYGMSFYAFNPLAGGLLTGKYSRYQENVEPGSRYDPNRVQGTLYRSRYWNDAYFDALDVVRPVAEKYGISMTEVALRWMMHHSMLGKEAGDAVIIGASSTKHLEENLKDFEKDPLPKEVLEALDQAWLLTSGVSFIYWVPTNIAGLIKKEE